MSLRATRLDLGDRVVLWQPVTGRHLPLTPELEARLAQPPPALRARLVELGLVEGHDVARLYPARSRWALWFPGEGVLWHALPLARGTGGHPFAAMALDAHEAAVWSACTGERTVRQVAEAVGCDVPRVLGCLGRWTAPEVQACQLRPRPVRRREPALAYLVAPARPAHGRQGHHYGVAGETTLARYHTEQIVDGSTHFDDREITLAHVFGEPHPALGGRAWGAALATGLGEVEGPVLEIGPGTGELCAAFRAVRPTLPYWRLDLSPELLRTQAARCPDTRSIHGSATDIPLEDGSVGLVICNEVLADLEAALHPGDWPVRPSPGQLRFNTGAWALVREVARVLRAGGRAFLSEFGALDELPTETTQLDHPEVSIHFGQLCDVARSVGLDARVRPVGEVVGIDRGARWLSRPSFEALRAWARSRGEHLPARAYTPDRLAEVLPWPVEGLWWVPVTEPGPAPLLDRMWALEVEKPQGAARRPGGG